MGSPSEAVNTAPTVPAGKTLVIHPPANVSPEPEGTRAEAAPLPRDASSQRALTSKRGAFQRVEPPRRRQQSICLFIAPRWQQQGCRLLH